jgi:hypothetical protein
MTDGDSTFKPLGEYTDQLIRDLIELRTRPYLEKARQYERIMEVSANPVWMKYWTEATAIAEGIEIDLRQRAQG